MSQEKETKQKVTIDVDHVIKRYNELNPEKKELNRERLAELVEKHPQLLSDWSRGKAPKFLTVVKTFLDLAQCSFDEIFKVK